MIWKFILLEFLLPVLCKSSGQFFRFAFYLIIYVTVFSPITVSLSKEKYPENEIPMYGNPDKPSFIEEKIREGKADKATINQLEHASNHAANLGWKYLKKNDVETAIKRFNQSWLINHENYQAYWGFATIVKFRDEDDEEANRFYQLAVELNDQHPKLLLDQGFNCLGLRNFECAKTSFFRSYDLLSDTKKCGDECARNWKHETLIGLGCISFFIDTDKVLNKINEGLEKGIFDQTSLKQTDDRCIKYLK